MTEFLAWAVVLAIVGVYVAHYGGGLRDGLARLVGGAGRGERSASASVRSAAQQSARVSAEAQRYGQHVAKITGLTVDQARARAEKYTRDAKLWEAVPAVSGDAERAAQLGPTLRELLGRWRSVKALYGEVNLSIDELAQESLPGDDVLTFGERGKRSAACWRVGHDVDGNPVLAEANEDALHVVHREGGAGWTTSYASVYHWILVRAYRIDGAGGGDRA